MLNHHFEWQNHHTNIRHKLIAFDQVNQVNLMGKTNIFMQRAVASGHYLEERLSCWVDTSSGHHTEMIDSL